jgi:hypothetical protein
MPRVRCIHNPTTGETKWEETTDDKNDGQLTIETSRGFCHINMMPSEKDTQNYSYICLGNDFLGCTVHPLMIHVWKRSKYGTIDDMDELYDPIEKVWLPEMEFVWNDDTVESEPNQQTFKKIHNNIVQHVLSQMEKGEAEPDEEFHEKERKSIEKTFADLCKKLNKKL